MLKSIDPFLLVIVDDQRRLFNVDGPITDDRPWIDRICRAQKSGQQVRCFTPPADQTREQIIASCERNLGLTYTEEVVVVSVTEEVRAG